MTDTSPIPHSGPMSPDPVAKARELLVAAAGVTLSLVYTHEMEPELVPPLHYAVVSVRYVSIESAVLPDWIGAGVLVPA